MEKEDQVLPADISLKNSGDSDLSIEEEMDRAIQAFQESLDNIGH